MNPPGLKEEIVRKLFHLLALIYVAGAVLLPRPTFLVVLVLLLTIEFFLETARLRSPSFKSFFDRYFGGLIRAHEAGSFTAIFWMVLGVLLSAVIVGPIRVLAAVYLFLILGDGVASLVGKSVGGPKWPGSVKSVSGSAACFLVCLGVGALLMRPDYSWAGILIGALAATWLEFGILPGNDNVTIPVGTSLVFLLIYRFPLGLFL